MNDYEKLSIILLFIMYGMITACLVFIGGVIICPL